MQTPREVVEAVAAELERLCGYADESWLRERAARLRVIDWPQPQPLPAVLEQARRAMNRSLNWLSSYPGGNAHATYEQVSTALSALSAYQPEPLPEAVRGVAEELRWMAGKVERQEVTLPVFGNLLPALAARLESAFPPAPAPAIDREGLGQIAWVADNRFVNRRPWAEVSSGLKEAYSQMAEAVARAVQPPPEGACARALRELDGYFAGWLVGSRWSEAEEKELRRELVRWRAVARRVLAGQPEEPDIPHYGGTLADWARLGEDLCRELLPHVGVTGANEGAVDTLRRLLAELALKRADPRGQWYDALADLMEAHVSEHGELEGTIDCAERLLTELVALRELTRPGDPCPGCGAQMRYDHDDHQHCYSCGRGYGATPVTGPGREAGGAAIDREALGRAARDAFGPTITATSWEMAHSYQPRPLAEAVAFLEQCRHTLADLVEEVQAVEIGMRNQALHWQNSTTFSPIERIRVARCFLQLADRLAAALRGAHQQPERA